MRPSIAKESFGLLGGVGAFLGVKRIVRNIASPYIYDALDELNDIPANEAEAVCEAMKKKYPIIAEKVKIITVTEENKEQILEQILKDLKNTRIYKFAEKLLITKFTNKFFTKNFRAILSQTASGYNGFYYPLLNKVFSGPCKSGIILHEMGHAINSNKNKFLKGFVMASRVLPMLILTSLILYPIQDRLLSHTETKTNSKPLVLKKIEKTEIKINDFIRNNPVKLLSISFLPMLIEEGVASLRAIKNANGILKPHNYTNLQSGLFIAWLSYLINAITTTGGAKLGLIIKDKIAG